MPLPGIRTEAYPAAKPPKNGLVAFCFACCVESGVLFLEAVDTSGGVNKTLLASVERVAVGADFSADVFALGGICFRFVAAVAANCCFVNFGMDIFFHDFLLSLFAVETKPYIPTVNNLQGVIAAKIKFVAAGYKKEL